MNILIDFVIINQFVFLLPAFQESYERAKTILVKHAEEHKRLAEALLQYETLDAEDVNAIINGE